MKLRSVWLIQLADGSLELPYGWRVEQATQENARADYRVKEGTAKAVRLILLPEGTRIEDADMPVTLLVHSKEQEG